MKETQTYMSKKDVMLRISFVCLGNIISGLGNGICIRSGLGADPLNVLFQGTALTLNVSEGTASLIVSAVMIAIAFVLKRTELGIGTVIAILVFSYGFDFGMAVVPECLWFPGNYGLMLFGLCVIAFGLAMSIYANYGKSSYDALIFSVMSKTKLEYFKVRWGLDLLFLITGILLGGRVTPATIIAVIVTGKIITFFVQLLKRTNWIKDLEV
ncbi:MAG: hypothetical protein Q4B75_00890 [Eubacteriales bacterium]|nr:hypothetical protein [Eubacteriales bacterium]